MIESWLLSTWQMISLSAGWLLFGFALAGIVHVLLPMSFVQRHLKKPGATSVIKAAAFGIPLPLCSCSVIPVGVSIRRAGASRGATASFFVSTPEVGVDSFFLSYILLGPLLAVMRVFSAFFTALFIGLSIDAFGSKETSADNEGEAPVSCCHGAAADSQKTASEAAHDTKAGRSDRLARALRYGFVDILDDLATLLLIGFLLAGLLSAIIPLDFFQTHDLGPLGNMLAILAISIPVYICATSATPLAAVLLANGLSPGAVLLLLLAGPATNVATILAIKRELGAQSMLIYVFGIIGVSLLIGFTLNTVLPTSGYEFFSLREHDFGHHELGVLRQFFGVLLLILLVRSSFRTTRARFSHPAGQKSAEPAAPNSCCHS